MDVIFEILFNVLGELLIQIIFELCADLGITVFSKKHRKNRHPIYTGLGYIMLGSIAGGLSLLIYSEAFFESTTTKIVYILLAPVLIGMLMAEFGKAKEKFGKQKTKLEGFFYA